MWMKTTQSFTVRTVRTFSYIHAHEQILNADCGAWWRFTICGLWVGESQTVRLVLLKWYFHLTILILSCWIYLLFCLFRCLQPKTILFLVFNPFAITEWLELSVWILLYVWQLCKQLDNTRCDLCMTLFESDHLNVIVVILLFDCFSLRCFQIK